MQDGNKDQCKDNFTALSGDLIQLISYLKLPTENFRLCNLRQT